MSLKILPKHINYIQIINEPICISFPCGSSLLTRVVFPTEFKKKIGKFELTSVGPEDFL